MSYDRSQRSSTPASSSEQSSDRATSGAGAGNAAAVSQMEGGGKARKTNLAFGFKGSELQSRNYQPAELKEALLDKMHNLRMEHTKDGADLTDTEKLYVAVKLMADSGIGGSSLAGKVQALFFDGGDSSSADRVSKVVLSGGEVHVEFTSSSGYHFVPGQILPMIATPPAGYTGRDTNVRGAQVDNLQNIENADRITRTGTFLSRRSDAVEQLFLLTPTGGPYARKTAAERKANAPYQKVLREFEIGLAVDYMDKGTYYVKQTLGPADGRSPQQLLEKALELAMGWTNANFAAEAHTVIELQDEAIAQRVLADLGYKADVDTDDVAASQIVRGR